MQSKPMRWEWAAYALSAVLLSGCGSWFGKSEGPPLPGERISVLQHQRTVAADPQAALEPIALPPAVMNPDWPQEGGNAANAMHNLQAGEIGRPAWQASVGSGTASSRPELASPVVAAGRVFTVDTRNVASAFDADTGKRVWRVDLVSDEDDEDDVLPGGIAYDGGRVYVSTGFGKVIALDAGSGKVVWSRVIGVPVHAPPTPAGGRVFVITVENQLLALNANDGSDVWQPYQALAEVARLLGGPGPAVDGGIVVAPFSSGELVTVRADNGRPVWAESLAPSRRTDEISALAQIRARPAIADGRVYAISAGGILAAFDIRTGQRLWDRDIGGLQSPWIAGQQLYQIANDGQLICVSVGTGRILWVASLPTFADEKARSNPILWSGPVMAGSRLFIVGSNGSLLTISPYDGKVIDRRALDARITLPPIVAGGTIYLLDDDGNLSAYR
jgi:outer membrane protein assembly factor BamB